jgi:hypothetical protein
MYQAKIEIGLFGRTHYAPLRKWRWQAEWDATFYPTMRSKAHEILTGNFHEPGTFLIVKGFSDR